MSSAADVIGTFRVKHLFSKKIGFDFWRQYWCEVLSPKFQEKVRKEKFTWNNKPHFLGKINTEISYASI